ncbi:BREX-1 system adenine-specific DNA-methyltransferase PglX [Donghicola tyrosinivorans]|uniref:site-specific DNA-methyltransferase (adenine-specific) n=1 Tax=Donghicola tyrosinivorans TaxID=1652492 RepID=A0A2T0X5U2_9RHOB|nr:BREX-1 system adenine-specific DNA-methyltransferase PglX [Donghicola tyrosinivorans]PRY94293.1 type II restriction/modification system DNA methylase subunit YeeA [Donghicola tyrosinivorans]
MDTTKLRKFALFARRALIEQVATKLEAVRADGAAAQREYPAAFKKLEASISQHGAEAIIEQVAYIWFNRFTALRFLDVNELNSVRVVSPLPGQFQPEILAEAKAGNINEQLLPEATQRKVRDLLEGLTPSQDPQAEAFQLLLVAICNSWQNTMPFLFERIDDYTELLLPADLLSNTSILAYLREAMTPDACRDVEIIGWLYQFYISEKKDQVFAGLKKNVKITAENIPAATQLFTPHWIVRYLVENSLGRLWLLNRPDSRLAERMDYYIAPEEPETDFLKITRPEEIRICDPAAGSGHMLTYAFDLLHAIYEEEGYDATEIPALILTHNLTGVEIDDRAGALAAFALMMKAADKLGRRRFLRMEAKPDICVLQDVRFTPAEMQDVAAVVGKDLFTDELRETLGQFEQAKNFGSLIVPKLRDPAETLRVVEARDFGSDLLLKDVQARVTIVLRMAEALSPKYHVVVANPPYMDISSANPVLKGWALDEYPDSSANLFALFMERGLRATRQNGLLSMINMQAWMFLSSFLKLRSKLLARNTLLSMAHLGENAFDTIGGDVVSTTAFIFENGKKESKKSEFLRLVEGANEAEKAQLFSIGKASRCAPYFFVAEIDNFSKLPGAPISYWASDKLRETFSKSKPLREFANPRKGMVTADNPRFIRQWYEVEGAKFERGLKSRDAAKVSGAKWFPYLKGGPFRRWYGNVECVVNWENDGAELLNMKGNGYKVGSTNHNLEYIFKPALSWTKITTGLVSFRSTEHGFLFDDASGLCPIYDASTQAQFAALLNSPVVYSSLGALNPTLNVNPGNLADIPVSLPSGTGAIAQNCIGTAQADWDAYETSWDFTTLPLLSPAHRGETLADSYATLRAHWQSMTNEMQALEQENNRIFIDAYGLKDELSAQVPLEEITLTCNPAYRYGVKGTEEDRETRLRADTMAEFLSYAVGCMFGRYSLDAPGLILANQGERLEDYLARIPEPTFMPDADNVIPVLDGDWFADDITERFRLFLRVTFGEAHFRENLRYVEESLGKDIRKYFTKDFYQGHVQRYKKRPIYWMFSSPKGTFNALIYMHRYRPDTVSVLLNDYLREFIFKLIAERERLEKLSDDPTATQGQKTKALKEAGVVAKQIDELNEWEREVIFPLAQQKIEIDLDDGVKANYPKFGTALKKIVGLS